jgi:predicted nucleic acid-binding protein
MALKVIHLDANFLIGAMRPDSREAAALSRWLESGSQIGISAIAWTEFLCGPLDSIGRGLVAQVVGEPEAFLGQDSVTAAELFNGGGRRRGSLADCMIAATALRVGAALATSNVRDFRKFPGLELASLD